MVVDGLTNMINIHNHYFRDLDVPRDIFGWRVKPILTAKPVSFIASRILRVLSRIFPQRNLERLYKVVDVSNKTSEEIYLNQARYYTKRTKFVGIAIDLGYCNAGPVERPYEEQLEELLDLKFNYGVIPFIHIDPRREGCYSLFSNYIRKGYKGLKLYPALGYSPDHENLIPIYEFCDKHGIPVLVHTGEESPTHYKASKRAIKRMLDKEAIWYDDSMSKRQLCGQWGHPSRYKNIIEKYKNINFMFAHMGSNNMVHDYLDNPEVSFRNQWYWIKEFIKKYDNVYADISYVSYDKSLWSYIKLLAFKEKEGLRICFGSDYYMNKLEGDEGLWSRDLRAYFGIELKDKLYIDNNKSYLGV